MAACFKDSRSSIQKKCLKNATLGMFYGPAYKTQFLFFL